MNTEYRPTYSCLLNLVRKLNKELLVLCSIFSSHEHFDRESAAFELFEMLGWDAVSMSHVRQQQILQAHLSLPL
jgi:hypothetical protein